MFCQLPKKFQSETEIDTLTESALWSTHEFYLYKAARFNGASTFYPVYRWERYYSFSPFPLLVKKGSLSIDSRFAKLFLNDRTDVARPNPLIDRDIERLGGPPPLSRTITDRDDFVISFAKALRNDTRRIEELNPGKTNLILCGGKDSLNMLLLDWRNPVVVLSAEPNFPLVQQFVRDNDLYIDVVRLDDFEETALRNREIAEGFCLVDMSNWKWAPHLARIVREYSGAAILWKGQIADAYLTDYWRSYTSRTNRYYQLFRKAYRKAAKFAHKPMDALFQRMAIDDFSNSLWERAAVMQGGHMGFLRSICDCLVLSAYHGPEAQKILTSMDFPKLTTEDVRPLIGAALAERKVRYPATNPSPPASEFRKNWRDQKKFKQAVNSFGVRI